MYSYRDLGVGLFILTAIGTIAGLLLATSELLEDRQTIYMTADAAAGLRADTRVFVQGLEVGRVGAVYPRPAADSLTFVAELRLDARFPDGTPFALPRGTEGVIAEPSPITAAVVRLHFPADRSGARLQPGDTIVSRRRASPVDQVIEVMATLQTEIVAALADTRALLDASTQTVTATQRLVAGTNRVVARTAPAIDTSLSRLGRGLARVDDILQEVAPRVGPLQDSVALALGDARGVLQAFDSLAHDARGLLDQNQDVLRTILDRLDRTTRILEHFATEVSRRPTRLLTGVTPPPNDSTRRRP